MTNDEFGDLMKAQEQVEAGRVLDNQFIMARLDGRSFSKFTKGMERPYDTTMSDAMHNTMLYLVEETHALLGYTQSDEITLVYHADKATGTQYMFGGKVQKLTSTLAAMASVKFNRELPTTKLPTFDARVWGLDTIKEVYDQFLWRRQDAKRNAVSMVAQSMFPHKDLQGVNTPDKISMIRYNGIELGDMPKFFTEGIYGKRVTKVITLPDEVLNNIPLQYRPTGPVIRSAPELMILDLETMDASTEFYDILFKK